MPLKTFEVGRNGLPYTNEWRFFFFGAELLSVGYYWSVGDCFQQAVLSAECLAMARASPTLPGGLPRSIRSTWPKRRRRMDVLIEINDGQMAVPSEHDLDELYGSRGGRRPRQRPGRVATCGAQQNPWTDGVFPSSPWGGGKGIADDNWKQEFSDSARNAAFSVALTGGKSVMRFHFHGLRFAPPVATARRPYRGK